MCAKTVYLSSSLAFALLMQCLPAFAQINEVFVRLNSNPFESPYYIFSTKENGASISLELIKGSSYTFIRTDTGHPFNIGSSWRSADASLSATSTGSGYFVSGVGSIEGGSDGGGYYGGDATADGRLVVNIPSDFNKGFITYYCYLHSSMLGNITVVSSDPDTDSDGTPDSSDLDDDNDGVIDTEDSFPIDADETTDTDGDGIGNNADLDDDADGVNDSSDAFPSDATETIDTDSDGIGNNADTDDDNDSVLDADDAFPLDASETIDTDADGIGNNSDLDDDGDGVNDSSDAFPLDATETIDTDSDGIGNNADTDDDNDSVLDADDVFPLDASESVDTDSDGVGDNADAFDDNAIEITDSDSDGVGDNSDAFPNDALYSIDSDSDGMPDSWELKYGLNANDPSDATSDQDNDGANALAEFLAGTIPAGSIDIDGNGEYAALTDGLLLLRGMFGLTGDALIGGAVASDAVYTTSADIEARIAMLGTLADIDGNGDVSALTDGLLALRYLFGLTGDALISGVIASDATRTTSVEIEAHIQSLTPAL